MQSAKQTCAIVVLTLLCLGKGLVNPGRALAKTAQNNEVLVRAATAPRTVVRKAVTLEPASSIDLHSEVGQRTKVLFIVPQGKVVSKGTPLVELDASALEEKLLVKTAQLGKTQAELRAAKAALERAVEEAPLLKEVAQLGLAVAEGAMQAFIQAEFPLQMKTAEREITIIKDKIALAGIRLKSLNRNADDPKAVQQSPEMAEMEGRLAMAEQKLQLLQTVLHEQKLNELKLAIAQKRLEEMRVSYDISQAQQQGKTRLQMVEIQYAMESDHLDRLKEQIDACQVHAPRDGVVLYQRKQLKQGMTVDDRQLLLRLADNRRFKLSVPVDLSLAQSLAPGQAVTVRVDAFPNQSFPAHISKIGVLSNQVRGTAQGLVTVLMDAPSGRLRKGMTAVLEFDL